MNAGDPFPFDAPDDAPPVQYAGVFDAPQGGNLTTLRIDAATGEILDGEGTIPVPALSDTDEAFQRSSIEGILDDLEDPSERATAVRSIRAAILDVIRVRADERANERDGNPRTPSDIRDEIVGLADDAETLAGIGGAMIDGAMEAAGIAGDLVLELPRGRRSVSVADDYGFDVNVRIEQPRALSVDVDEVVLVIRDYLAQRYPRRGGIPPNGPAYCHGVDDGIETFRSVLSTTPTFRSTALDALSKRLQREGFTDLAKRVDRAFGKVDRGEAKAKITRTPAAGKGGEDV